MWRCGDNIKPGNKLLMLKPDTSSGGIRRHLPPLGKALELFALRYEIIYLSAVG